MTCVLRIKNDKGEWVNIPAITGESAYEIAVRDGFSGTEKEWLAYITPSVKAVSGGIEVTVGSKTVFVAGGTDGKDGEDGKTVTKVSELENDMGYLRKENEDIRLTAHQTYISGGSFVVGELAYGMSVSGNRIESVGTPEAETDATNKAYVDNAVSKKKVPTKVSELTNDNGYITAKDVPTKLSSFSNDCGFITDNAVPKKLSELEADSISGYELSIGASALNISGGSIHINKADYGFYVDGNRIRSVGTPEDSADAANKGYVDGLVGGIDTALDSILAMQNSLIGGDAI